MHVLKFLRSNFWKTWSHDLLKMYYILFCIADFWCLRNRDKMYVLKAKLQENQSCCEGDIQRLFKQLKTMSHSSRHQTPKDRCSQSSASSSSSSDGRRLTRQSSVPSLSSSDSVAEGQSSRDYGRLTPTEKDITQVSQVTNETLKM